MSEKIRVSVAIGVSGHGKSSTANSLVGHKAFKTSSSLKSETSEVTGVLARWRGMQGEEPIIVIDTPGFGDSEGRDAQHIARMV